MRALLLLSLTVGLASCKKESGPEGVSATGTPQKVEPPHAVGKGPDFEKVPPHSLRPRLETAGSIDALLNGVTSSSFNFSHLPVLWVRIVLPGINKVHPVTIRLRSPEGTLFYDGTVPFTADPTVTDTEMPTLPHRVTAHRAKEVPGGFVLDYPIGILGSSVTRFPEPGDWTVEVDVEGSGHSLTKTISAVFVL